MSNLHTSELKTVQGKFARDMEDANFRHQNDLEKLRLEMGQLKGELMSAEERFNNRPSRPEDLVKIGEMENLLIDADERIRSLIVSCKTTPVG